jgi:hypothetical protein
MDGVSSPFDQGVPTPSPFGTLMMAPNKTYPNEDNELQVTVKRLVLEWADSASKRQQIRRTSN